jgi:hypothetical protein
LIFQLSVSFLFSLPCHFNWYDVAFFSDHVNSKFEMPPVHGCLYHYIDLGNFLLWVCWILLSFVFQLFLPFVHFPEFLHFVIWVYIFFFVINRVQYLINLVLHPRFFLFLDHVCWYYYLQCFWVLFLHFFIISIS